MYKKRVGKINLRKEYSKGDDKNDQVEISQQVNFSLSQMLKYSEYVQEEINKNDVIKKIEQEIKQMKSAYKIKEEHIKTFFQLINEENVEIKNEQYSDLLKLTKRFKINTLKKVLEKYAERHSNDIEFIINQIQENNKENKDNENNTNDLEKYLISRINECLTNEKFNELPITAVYQIIKESSTKEIDNNLLYSYIEKKKEERYVLYEFLKIDKLNEDNFTELYENYNKSEKSTSADIKYYSYLSHNLHFIKLLKETQQNLSKEIQNLRQNNELNQTRITKINKTNQQLQLQIAQKDEENEQLKTANQKIQSQMTQINTELQQAKEELNKSNLKKSDVIKCADTTMVGGYDKRNLLGEKPNKTNQKR